MLKLINRLIHNKILKNKTFLIFGIAIIIITISLISFSLLTSDYRNIEESDSQKTSSDSMTHSFTYQIESFDVPTTIVNGSISRITKLNDTNSVLIEMNSFNQGHLIIQIPKTMLKALNDDYSKFSFIVLSDGKETIYELIDSETIKINFESSTKEIEIIGTSKLN